MFLNWFKKTKQNRKTNKKQILKLKSDPEL